MNYQKSLSKIQGHRVSSGSNYEKHLIAKSNKLGYNILDISSDNNYALLDRYSDNKFFLDGLLGNYFFEITTVIGDGKMAKIDITAKLAKEQYPNCKVIVVAKAIKAPRKRDGMDNHYDYVKSRPHVDDVIIGEVAFFEYLKSLKTKQLNIIKPNTLKPKIMNNSNELNLVKYLIDNDEVSYATKVVSMVKNQYGVDVVPSTPSTHSTTDKSKYSKVIETRKINKDRFMKSLNPYNPTKNLMYAKDILRLKTPISIVNRKQSRVDKYINSGIFYNNPNGTQDFMIDVDRMDIYNSI